MSPRRSSSFASEPPPQDLSAFELSPDDVASAGKQTAGVVERQSSSSQSAAKRRLSLPLTPAGLIDWESMRVGTKAEANQVLSADPGVRALHEPAEPVTLAKFDESAARSFLDAFSAVERVVFGKLLHLDAVVAAQVFVYSPEAHSLLDPPLCDVLNKYTDKLPDWIVKYKEEFVFGMAFLKVTVAQLSTARQMQFLYVQQQQQQHRRADRAGGPIPVYPAGTAQQTQAEQPI